ncbi:zn-finger domain-containing protein [Gigaspora margarita]|uniref:Zn-finger domain-containing protein n=1 Tax=Gigaspora margarita TaxID=4874 RepID=A0A8H4A8K8_GIGMA|nr:zn-finger domain-containing protein [Gigaspora margarita]
MIFVLDNLTEDNDLNKILMKVYEDWNNMYLMSRYEEFSKKDLENFEKLEKQFVDIFQEFSSSRLKFPKLHSWVYYTTDLIKKVKNNNLNSKLHFGLNNLLEYLDIYFGLMEQNNLNNSIVKIYSSVTIQNGLKIHATNSYYRKACYSNVAVAMNFEELFEYLSDHGICYRQVCLLAKIELEAKIFNLALIQ